MELANLDMHFLLRKLYIHLVVNFLYEKRLEFLSSSRYFVFHPRDQAGQKFGHEFSITKHFVICDIRPE